MQVSIPFLSSFSLFSFPSFLFFFFLFFLFQNFNCFRSEPVFGDVTDESALQKGCTGADHVVHLAAKVSLFFTFPLP